MDRSLIMEAIGLDWSEDCEEFLNPKRTCKHPDKNSETPIAIATSNRFDTLNVEAMETDSTTVPDLGPKSLNSFGVLVPEKETNKANPENITSSGQKKCPPITITQRIGSYTQFHQKLKSILKHKYQIKYNKEEIKITTMEISDHRALISALKKENIEYYTFTPKNETKKKMVMKAACFMTEEEIIKKITKDERIKQNEI